MSDDENSLLDNSLVWDQAGHLSEVALNAIVDAESALLPRSACEHADGCEQCGLRIGQLAQLSLEVDSAFLDAGIAHAHVHARARVRVRVPSTSHMALKPVRGWPLTELAFALVLALLGQLPTLQALDPAGIRHTLKGVVHLSVQVFQHIAGTAFGASLPWVSATLLVAASSSVAFAARRGFTRKLETL
jgi:hypothetical protein